MSGAYGPDRWSFATGTGGSYSLSKETAVVDSGSAAAAKVVYVHGSATSFLGQSIENYAEYRGRTLAISIRLKTATASAVRVRIYDGISSAYTSYHSGNNTWETLIATLAIAANATLVWAQVVFEASCTVYLDNATLIVGTAPADYVPLTPAEEWERCQRYYEKHGGG